MKKFLVALFLLITASSYAQSYEDLDNKFGFKKFIFQTQFSSYKGLKLVEKTKGGANYYGFEQDTFALGKYKINKLLLQFYNGKLITIVIKTKGLANSRGVLSVFKSAYGKGDQPNKYLQEYYWIGQKVSMIYIENSATGDATIYMQDDKANQQYKEDVEAKDRKTAEEEL